MSHPLRSDEIFCRVLGKPWAAVQVELVPFRERPRGTTLQLAAVRDADGAVASTGALVVANSDVKWARLPNRFAVVGPDGEHIQPSPGREFYISIETFNPFHLVMEHEP